MKVTRRYYNIVLMFVLTLSLMTSGCGNLGAIRKFAEISAVVGQGFPELSADLCQSCIRQYRYKFYRKVNFNPHLMAKIDELSENETLTHNRTGLPDNVAQEAIKAEKDCRVFKEVEPLAKLLNQSLIGYLKTMGELAADELTSYDKELDKLGASLVTANIFNQPEVAAGGKLAKLLFKVVSESYRRGKLKEAIGQSNDDIKILTSALKRYAGNNYVLALQAEERELTSLYKESIFQQQSNVGSTDPLHTLSIKSIWDSEQNQLRIRIAGARAYVQVLEKVEKGHQELYDKRDHLNSKDALRSALQFAKDIHELVDDFRKAF